MAFDYGSIDLGIKNPFKKEGLVTALRGGIQTLLGIYLLLEAVDYVQTSKVSGWLFVIFGALLLGVGLKALGGGIYAMLRYFVGRNHPTSLAKNFTKSEAKSNNQQEGEPFVYSKELLEEMLIGRKNSTFLEPQGFLARLLHSLAPKLLFMPYPIRNLMQRLFGAWVKTGLALVAYGFVAFVSLTGLAGEAGEVAFPIYSVALLLYVILIWRKAARPLSRAAETGIEALDVREIVKVVVWSIMLPVVVALLLNGWSTSTSTPLSTINNWLYPLPSLHTYLYLLGMFAVATVCSGLIALMLFKRLNDTNPVTEVSELRENWQESVHPNEIFINLDNLVMANRRYKEVPNRVYQELDPWLEEQVENKGGFRGQMIQEIQPKFTPLELGSSFTLARMISLISGNLLYIVASVLFFALTYEGLDIATAIGAMGSTSLSGLIRDDEFVHFLHTVMPAVHLILLAIIAKAFASLLTHSAHVFFAEMRFESQLIYFKCEGTFTESKISTGTGIHDSTRSENTLVRSSITPWVIVSRIVTTTFAATGMRNLEHPRYILEMHKDDQELSSIRSDVINFLKDRESIASITNDRDLGNASQIHSLNQQTRAFSESHKSLSKDDEAAGFLRQENTTD